MSDESGYSLGIDLGQTPWPTATAEHDAPRDAVGWPAVGNDTLSGPVSGSGDAVGQIVTLVVVAVDLLTERRGTAPAIVILALPTDGQFADDDIAGSVAERLRLARGSVRIIDAADAAAVGLAYLRGETTGAGGSDPARFSVAVGAALLGLDDEHRTGAGIATAGAGGAAVGGLGATVLAGGSTGAAVGAVTGAVGAVGVPLGVAGVGAVGVPLGVAGVGAVGVPLGVAGVGAVGVPIGAAAGLAATGTSLGPRLRRLARQHRTALIAGGVALAAVVAITAAIVNSSGPSRSVVRAVSSVPSSVRPAALDTTPVATTPVATTIDGSTTTEAATTAEVLPVIVVATTEPPPPTQIPVIVEAPSTAVAAAPTSAAVAGTTSAVASTKRTTAPTAPGTSVKPVATVAPTIVASTPTVAVGASGAKCAVGSWVVDNASVASAFAGAAGAGGQMDVAGVTGAVRVTIAANGAALTTFDNWKLSANLPNGAGVAVVSKAGSETAMSAFAGDGTFVVSGVQINSTTQVSMAGTVFVDGPSKDAMIQNGSTYSCRGDRIEVRVSGAVDYVVAMSRGA